MVSYKGMILLFCLTIFISPIISAEVLVFPLEFDYISPYGGIITTLMKYKNGLIRVQISLASSGYLLNTYKSIDNFDDLAKYNIKYDRMFPEKPTSGNITQATFYADRTSEELIKLNVLYNSSVERSILGLARRVNYNNPEIEKLYDLDFMSQLLNQGVINKYYIYFHPFYYLDGDIKKDNASLELGRLPIYFTNKFNYSYTPLNKRYPTKWAAKLSHIILNDIKQDNIYEINADVIFTDSNNRNKNILPEKLRPFFTKIFGEKMGCDINTWDNEISCPTNKINTTKFYLVFNGYAHYIPGSLLFWGLGDKFFCSFTFSSEVDYISIDSQIFGVYHRLYDGENNTVRFACPNNPNFIIDVSEYTGYESRVEDEEEIPSIEYLRNWERRLKEKELRLNETLKRIEEEEEKIRERTEQLNKKEEENREKIEKYEKEIQELNEKVKLDKDIIWHLINNCNKTSHS